MGDMDAGVKTVPAIRGLAALRLLGVFFGNGIAMLQRFDEATGEISRFRFAGRNVFYVKALPLVHEVLTERDADFRKGRALRVFARPLLGNGLLTSVGDFHRRQRRLIAPAFAPRRVTNYAAGMVEMAERAQAGWRDGQPIDIDRAMMRLTLGIVCKTLFSADVEGEVEALGRAMTTTMRFVVNRVRTPIPLSSARPFPWQRRARDAFALLDATIYRMIALRRAAGPDAPDDLLSLLLEARDQDDGSGMTDRQVRDEAMTIFVAGHETTANALAWTWYLLAQHEDVYERVRREADAALGGRAPTGDDLPRLPYALQVFKEAMRLYPPAYGLVRQAVRDTVIGGWRIPERAILLISPYLLHRRPDLFPDPERFDPERFTPERERERPRYAYLPFGGGPRLCIGHHFALMEGHLVVAALAQRVTLALAPDQPLPVATEPLITLRPRGGIRMIVGRRA